MKLALVLAATALGASGMETVALPGKSPIVTLRIVFRTGSAADPTDKPGLAAMTAAMISDAGTRQTSYRELVEAMFPMATSVQSTVDKEMTAFIAETHIENLDAFYKLFRSMLLEPGWRDEDLARLRDQTVNYLRVSLRGANDEELGKEVLDNEIYRGHPYGHHSQGTVSSIEKLTLDDLRGFYKQHYTQANLILGIAGGYPPAFLDRIKTDLGKLPAGKASKAKIADAPPIEESRVTIIDKQTRSVAYSFGHPIDVVRGHPDYPALLLASSYFGHHRSSGGRLFDRMRGVRGLNYGDYSYIEYFPRGMFLMEPEPNLARSEQIFQIWIRPVEPDTAMFALRLASFELDKLIRDGLSEEDFQRTRSFVAKNANLLTRTKNAELGYAIDSLVYGIPPYKRYLDSALAGLTREKVNAAISKHLRTDHLQYVVVTSNGEEFKRKLLAGEPSPMTYNSPKPEDVVAEDKIVERFKIALKPEQVKVVPVSTVFE